MELREASDPATPLATPVDSPAGSPADNPAEVSAPADLEPMRPAPYAGFSMRPAMVVVGLAALIVGAFIAIGLATNGPPVQTDTSTAQRTISGTSLRAVPATDALKVITLSGQPPSNIINSVSIPAGATRISHQNNSAAADQYDAQIGLVSNASQGALRTFYLRDMKAQGWKITDQGAADHDPGALEVLGQKAGSDGYFWEMGAVISATTFGTDVPPAGHTQFTVRLFQVPDPD
jgi:hypothetical protein